LLRYLIGFCIAISAAWPAAATTPRQTLTNAAFATRDKTTALAQIAEAEDAADAILVRQPGDREAYLIRAMAIGYRAKLSRSRSSALAARKMFDALSARDPQDPEAQALVGGWHIDAVSELGGFVAGAALSAKKNLGLKALDRSVALGGNRAMYPGIALLLRLSLDPADANAERLAAMTAKGTTPFELDRLMQRAAAAILIPLRSGDRRGVQALAKQLLPFGRVPR
jgi:hypothetical protein